MIIYSIYKYVNLINGKVYIGFTHNIPKRKKEHINDSKFGNNKFYRAVRKHGWDCFSFEIIYQSKDKNHCLKQMETHFISEYNSYKNGYNSTMGGDGAVGYKHSKESRQKMSNNAKSKTTFKDNEGNTYKLLINDPLINYLGLVGVNKNRTYDDQQRKNMANSLRGNKNRLGKKHSDEIRKIISERTSIALKGKPKKTIECPNCHRIGGMGNMKRYHFDFCKFIT